MIVWSDYDRRITKVWCDNCETEVTDVVGRYLTGKGIPKRQRDLWGMLRQWPGVRIPFTNWVFVVTIFKSN